MSSAPPKATATLAFRASIAALALALAGLAALWLWGFGDLDAGYAIEPPSFAVAYAALFTVALVAVVAALRLRRHLRGGDAAKDGKAPSRKPMFAVLAVLTVLEAAPAGYGLLRARNALSDDRMFAAAVAPPPGDPSVRPRLARYFEKGQRHRDEVSTRFIDELGGDREKLRQAVAEGGPLASRAAEALQDADWAEATKAGNVGALSSFLRDNPGSKHADEARKRIHAMYEAGREQMRGRPVPPDAERFRAALLDALEERADTRVTVLVTTALAKSVEQADEEYAAKYGAHYVRAASRFSPAALAMTGRQVRLAVATEIGRAFPGGLAEVTEQVGDEGRPVIGIDLTPVAYAAQTWGSPDDKGKDDDLVTPAVGFLVEVQGVVRGRDGQKTTIAWRLKLEDDTEGKMEVAEDQAARAPASMLDAAFADFVMGVPKRVAASFAERL
jgi:hypothetical protein